MAIIDDVRQMQLQGTSDEQIVTALRERGMKYKEIVDAISQSKIMGAVEQPSPEPAPYENPLQESQMQQASEAQQSSYPSQQQPQSQPQYQQPSQYQQKSYSQQSYPQAQPLPQFSAQDEVMQPSIMNAEYQEAAYQDPSQQYPQDQQQYPQDQQQYDQYGQQYAQPDQYGNYQQYAGYVSPDTITEISEQVVAEKLSEIRKHLEKVIDFRTTIDSKISFIDERLKRIEKIIETLQTSVLRKVGDYVTDISDIKNELIQTQKTFAKILESKQSSKQKPQIQKQENHHANQQHSSQHQNNNPHHEHKR